MRLSSRGSCRRGRNATDFRLPNDGEHDDMWGVFRPQLAGDGRVQCRWQARIPVPELRPEGAVECPRAHLEQQVCLVLAGSREPSNEVKPEASRRQRSPGPALHRRLNDLWRQREVIGGEQGGDRQHYGYHDHNHQLVVSRPRSAWFPTAIFVSSHADLSGLHFETTVRCRDPRPIARHAQPRILQVQTDY
jgi:hypothetical protein